MGTPVNFNFFFQNLDSNFLFFNPKIFFTRGCLYLPQEKVLFVLAVVLASRQRRRFSLVVCLKLAANENRSSLVVCRRQRRCYIFTGFYSLAGPFTASENVF
jgi:hypothetical protein